MGNTEEEKKQVIKKIAKILDDARTSYATHNRKLKELSILRSKSHSVPQFFSAFCAALIPVFHFQKRLPSAERVVRFVSVFATLRDNGNGNGNDSAFDEFLDLFLKFLLVAAAAANKTARSRACQIVSEVWMNCVVYLLLRVGFIFIFLYYIFTRKKN